MNFKFSIKNPSKKTLNLFFPNKRKKTKENIFKTMGKDYYKMSLKNKYRLINYFKSKL